MGFGSGGVVGSGGLRGTKVSECGGGGWAVLGISSVPEFEATWAGLCVGRFVGFRLVESGRVFSAMSSSCTTCTGGS